MNPLENLRYALFDRPAISLLALRAEREGERFLRGQPELWRLLSQYLADSASTGCSYADYAYLYRRVRSGRFREVLECGTGVSTVVLAHAAMENTREGHPCRVSSLESIEKWYEMARKLLPDELRDYATVHYSEVVPAGFSIYRGVRYASPPDRAFDFVFTDGPYATHDDGTVGVNFDFIHLLQNSDDDRAMSTVVDYRLSTCFVLQQILPSHFHYDPTRKLGLVSDAKRQDLRPLAKASPRELKRRQRAFGRTVFRSTLG